MNKILRLALYLSISCNLSLFAQTWVTAGTVTNPGNRPSISVASPDIVWIADGGTTTPKIFKTLNAGANWTAVQTAGIDNELYCVWAFTANTVFVGEGVVSGNAKLLKTTNGGTNWTTVLTTDNNRGHFNGLGFTKNNGNIFGLAIAERLYRTSNNGANWVEVNAGVNGVSNAQNSLVIIDNNFYGFGLNNGSARVRLTTDNSGTWTTQTLSVSGNYTSAIAFHSNKLFGLAATSTSLPNIARTTDGGLTWTNVNIGTGPTGNCYLNWIPNGPVVYIMGENGIIKRSTNNGLNWVTTPTPVSNLTHFDFVQVGSIVYGYAVSSNGGVIKLTDSLTILTSNGNHNSEIPNEFSLSQNYPNPFNPSTMIEYNIPEAAYVTLKVYSILGNETAVLVNERKTAGAHESVFDASKFASGIYYYTITAGEFTKTKKMILLK